MAGCEAWPVTWPRDTGGVDPDIVEMAESLAVQLLRAMSGFRVGRCEFTESFRPSGSGHCGSPYKDGRGFWHNDGRASGGSCCRVLLSHRPVSSVVQVVDGGSVLDASLYRLEGSWLRRRDACWAAVPPCDDPDLIVTYQAGAPFPAGTGSAVGEVAWEYAIALQGDQCRLPSRATSIQRQGVTVTLDSIDSFVKRGRLGLPIADAWLDSVIGTGPRVPSRVYSPDLARGTRA